MTHPDFINVRKTQSDFQVASIEVFFYLIYFAADVTRRRPDKRQKFTLDYICKYFNSLIFHAAIITFSAVIVIDNR